MKHSIYDGNGTVDHLLQRLDRIDASDKPRWGVMTPAQMLKHLQLENDLALGNYRGKDYSNFAREWAFKAVFRGGLGVPMMFRKFRMVPAIPELDVLKSGAFVADFETEKANFKRQFSELLLCRDTAGLHPAIGKMNRDDWGMFYAWHTDYHLTQFGV